MKFSQVLLLCYTTPVRE